MGMMIKKREKPKPTTISAGALYEYLGEKPANMQISLDEIDGIFKAVYFLEHNENWGWIKNG